MGCSGSKQAEQLPVASAPGDFKVTLERKGEEPFGLGIVKEPDNTYRVHFVKEDGLVPTWNKANENTPEVLVKEGDIIVVVNGVVGDLTAMYNELKQQRVTLSIKRGNRPAAAVKPAVHAAATAEVQVATALGVSEAEAEAEAAAEAQMKAAVEAEGKTIEATKELVPSNPEAATQTIEEASDAPKAPSGPVVTTTESLEFEPADSNGNVDAEKGCCKVAVC